MDRLEELGLAYRESDAPTRNIVDFTIEDGSDIVASVWGDKPTDVDFECEHPSELIEYDDDETVGECPVCGCFCDWHYGVSADDGYTVKERIPHEWYPRRNPGGIIGKILEEVNTR